MDLDRLELSTRAKNCLKAAGIASVEDLVELTEIDLFKTPNLGRATIEEIKVALSINSLSLKARTPQRVDDECLGMLQARLMAVQRAHTALAVEIAALADLIKAVRAKKQL